MSLDHEIRQAEREDDSERLEMLRARIEPPTGIWASIPERLETFLADWQMPSSVIPDCLGYSRGGAQLFHFGAVGSTNILYFASSDDLSDGLEACAALLLEQGSVGYFSEPEYPLLEDGTCSVCGSDQAGEMCEHFEEAEVDHTYTESGWLLSWEWKANTIPMGSALRYAAEQANFGAMVPEVTGPEVRYWEVDGAEDLYPQDYFGRSQVALEEDVDLEEVEESIGIHARLTMPGCLDSTSWACYASWEDAFVGLLEDAE